MKKPVKHRHRGDWLLTTLKHNWQTAAFLVVWIAYFSYFWSNAVVFTPEGNLAVRHVNIWGDWAAHFTLGSSFAYRDGFPESSPFLLGAPLSYPFLVNYLSALLIKAGVPFFTAFTVPSYLFSILFGVAVVGFYRITLKQQTASLLATLFFVFNGGLGFLHLFNYSHRLGWYEILLNPPLRVTNIEDEFIRWISIVPSMIIPQRAFVMGFPLAVLILTGLYRLIYQKKAALSKRSLIAAICLGIWAGSLVLIHTHSFLALFVICTGWTIPLLQKKYQPQLYKILTFGITTALVAVPLWLLFFQSHITHQGSFVKWYPGWYSNENDINWLTFWFKNWGIVPLFALAGIYQMWRQKLSSWQIWLPFFVLFAMVNLVLWQPFIWDNTKLLVWASLGFSGLAGYFFAQILGQISTKNIYKAGVNYVFITAILGFSFASGAVDIWRTIRPNLNTHIMYSSQELALAEWVKAYTDPNSIWVTPWYHNQWLFNLTGRQTVMAYPGWLWTHGYDYTQTQIKLSNLYANPALGSGVLAEKNVDYILYQPQNEPQATREEFDARFTVVYENGPYTIYSVK